MPSSSLFAVSNKGRVYTLQTDTSVWKELPYLGIDFKRVSAHDSVVWALGGDHQIYVYVYGTSVPIRVCEESYENQRWNPVEGFTGNLLPTDRRAFSSSDGLTERKLSSIHLPSLAWNWEGPWHLQDTFEGKALDKECWTYAMDFPRSYSAEKKWNSCVRRRKWIRYRRYIALDTWSAVPSIHDDHTEEPFIDICVGGGEVSGEDSDCLMVWGITALGKVIVREGISATSPEGNKWTYIPTPINQDLTSVSISRCGRVWAVSWDGSILVRTGITRESPLGVGWVTVEPPENLSIRHISVGNNVVWAVCRDSSLWFRRGLTEDNSSGHTNLDNNDLGNSWLKMVGSFIITSVGPNDQVWALMADDHSLTIRTGINYCELSGKTWKIINLPLINFDPDKMEEEIFDEDSDFETDRNSVKESTSLNENPREQPDTESESQECVSMNSDNLSLSSDKTAAENTQVNSEHIKENPNFVFSETDNSVERERTESCVSEFHNLNIKNPDEISGSLTSSVISDTMVNFIGHDYPFDDDSIQNNGNRDGDIVSKEHSENESVDSAFAKESTSSYDSRIKTKFSSSPSSVGSEVFRPKEGQGSFGQEDQPVYGISIPDENIWMWVSGGGCWVNSQNLPKWFIADYHNFVASEPWRLSILEQLNKRKRLQVKEFSSYDEAVESSSWAVNGQCRFLIRGQWAPATLELQMIGSKGSQVREASFTIVYTLGSKKKILISCCSIVLCILTVNLPAKAVVSLYTSNQPLSPLSLLFSAEKDAEEWLSHVNSVCTKFRGLDSAGPSSCAIWAITSQGFIYVHDFSSSEEELRIESRAAHRILPISDGRTPVSCRLERGFRPGCFITVKGKIHEEAKRFDINLLLDEEGHNVALHFNPRFNQKNIIMNSKENGYWSNEERCNIKPLVKGKEYEFTILCDDRDMKISVSGRLFYRFNHRLMPGDISLAKIEGDFTVSGVVYNYGAGERTMREYFWQGVGGHLRVIEGGAGGITWGVSYDSHVYVYSGGTAGGIYKGSSTDANINIMSDIRHFYVYENQRWNPLTGFTYRGLPTDRNTWSDRSGRHPRTKEGTKLFSRHWQWISEWTIDHHTPEGVDKEGWQYATDFPMSYHSYRYVTDLVRRRRWVRKCRISTSGPWKQMEKVMLISVSVSPQYTEEGTVPVWGVSVSNEVVMREGVTQACPKGTRWVLISSETPMKVVSAGVDGGVWAISCIGQAHYRVGVTKTNPKGCDWVNVDAPTVPLKEIGFGNWKVWTIDRDGNLYFRANVQPLFPEGTAWQRVCGDVERISVSADGSLWSILHSFTKDDGETVSGVIARRNGVSPECPGGTSWDICTGTGWNFVSARMPVP